MGYHLQPINIHKRFESACLAVFVSDRSLKVPSRCRPTPRIYNLNTSNYSSICIRPTLKAQVAISQPEAIEQTLIFSEHCLIVCGPNSIAFYGALFGSRF